MLRDLFNQIRPLQFISPDEGAGNDNPKVSTIIDLANTTSNLFVIATGTLVDADATFTVLIEDGDDPALADGAAVPDAYLIGTEAGASFTFTHDNKVRKIAYIGPKRYVRMTITPANNTGAWDICAIALLSGHRVDPQSSQS